MGIPKEEASFLLSIVGICSMMGRIINGVLADHPKVNAPCFTHVFRLCISWWDCHLNFIMLCTFKVSVLLLNNIGLSASGLLIILCPFFISYKLLVFYSIVLGLALCKYTYSSFFFSNKKEKPIGPFLLFLWRNSLHRCYTTNFTWWAPGIRKCQQRLRLHARVLRGGYSLRNSHGWYANNH